MTPRANLDIENAELIMAFRNFSGREGKNNKEGDRNFAVYIPDDVAEQLKEDGWNIKMSNRNSDEYESRPYLNVAVRYKFRPPEIYVGTNPDALHRIGENEVGELDWADIVHVDLSIRPRFYDVNGRTGIKAYLSEMYVIISKSKFAAKYGVVHDVAQSSNTDDEDDEIPF